MTWKAEQTFFKCSVAQSDNKIVKNYIPMVQKNKETQEVSLIFGATFLPENCTNIALEQLRDQETDLRL